MRSSLKDRIIIVLIISIGVLVVLAMIYSFNTRYKSTGMLTASIKVITEEDKDEIETLRRRKEGYAFVVKGETEQFLKVYMYSSFKETYSEAKFIVTNKQLEQITVGKPYWFQIKFINPEGESEDGVVKKVYTSNPALR